MRPLAFGTLLSLAAFPAVAQDASVDEGEQHFSRQCVACHVVQNAEGEMLAGRNARTGPNLYGVAGRTLGADEDFRYSDYLVALGEQGAIWNESNFVAYVQDPTGWLREKLDDRRARGKMAYRVRSEEEARDLFAYLATFTDPAELEAAIAEGASLSVNQ